MLIDYDHLVVRPRASLILILRYIKGSVIIIVPSVTKNRNPLFDGPVFPYMLRALVITTRKMVPITGRARSFLLVFKNKIERRGRRNKN